MDMRATVMMNSNQVAHNKTIVRAYYDGAMRGEIMSFCSYLHSDFVCSAPKYLPWGGRTRGANAYLDAVLPQISKVLDFGRFTYDSITAEGERVIALVNVGIIGSAATIKISEHWVIEGETARSVWTAFFEPIPLLEVIEHNKRAT
jgi:ketosteroid isomerase-like protein